MINWPKFLVTLALTLSVGGHWAVIQGVAWTRMIAHFSQAMPFTQAISYTFDGKHPCKLCLAVKSGQESERKDSKLKSPEKLVFFLDLGKVSLFTPDPIPSCFLVSMPHPSWLHSPPYPPPRGFTYLS